MPSTESQSSRQKLAVAFNSEDAALGEQWAQRLLLPVTSVEDTSYPLHLLVNHGQLSLKLTEPKAPGAISVDFIGGALGHRRRFGGGRGQTIAKAVGLKGGKHLRILDITAGLGRDAFVLASLGAQVTMVERSPIIAALLENALARAKQDAETTKWISERLYLINSDSLSVLQGHNFSHMDVVYMDPMYPHRSKSALVKKEMRILREVVGDDQDSAQLLEAALHFAEQRVVVKRPAKAPPVGDKKPNYSLEGKTTRYDVYLSLK